MLPYRSQWLAKVLTLKRRRGTMQKRIFANKFNLRTKGVVNLKLATSTGDYKFYVPSTKEIVEISKAQSSGI